MLTHYTNFGPILKYNKIFSKIIAARHLTTRHLKSRRGIISPFVEIEIIGSQQDMISNKYTTKTIRNYELFSKIKCNPNYHNCAISISRQRNLSFLGRVFPTPYFTPIFGSFTIRRLWFRFIFDSISKKTYAKQFLFFADMFGESCLIAQATYPVRKYKQP